MERNLYSWSMEINYDGDFNNGKKAGKGTYIIEKEWEEKRGYLFRYEGYFKDGFLLKVRENMFNGDWVLGHF